MEIDQGAKNVAAPPATVAEKKLRKRGPMTFLKAAMVVMRGSGKAKKKAPAAGGGGDVASNALKIVGSMRPLHVPESNSPRAPPLRVSVSVDNFMDVYPPPMSPSAASSAGSSTDGMSSRYASAQNLQELDRPDNDGEDANAGDEMIDVKAKEFIAHFYEHMRLEREESVKRASA